MKGEAGVIHDFLGAGNKRQYVIPVYQRTYDWQNSQCKQFFDDIKCIMDGKHLRHFLGSIVAKGIDGTDDQFVIIDGQQRLTTLSILILAMSKYARETSYTSTDDDIVDFSEFLRKGYLANDVKPTSPKYSRMRLVNEDQLTWNALLTGIGQVDNKSNIIINYEYFLNRIRDDKVNLDDLFTALKKLWIVKIILETDDDPQLIFESLNSTGLALTEGDKIRNYILMSLPEELQKEYYEKYWHQIEVYTKHQNDKKLNMIDAFIRDFLTLKQGTIAKFDRVYDEFKEFAERNKFEQEYLLSELLKYAKQYNLLINENSPNKELNHLIYRINYLEADIVRPFFLDVLSLRDEGVLSLSDVVEIFSLTESYILRGAVSGVISAGRNKVFAALSKSIRNIDSTTDQYVDKFKYKIINKGSKIEFPDDQKFVESFKTLDAFKYRRIQYILERFENYGTTEIKHIEFGKKKGFTSIEHIMPQNLNSIWRNELGDKAEIIHEDWVNRIANLTITNYNASLSDKSFHDKCTNQNGYNNSGFKMNQWISHCQKWSNYSAGGSWIEVDTPRR